MRRPARFGAAAAVALVALRALSRRRSREGVVVHLRDGSMHTLDDRSPEGRRALGLARDALTAARA